MQTASVLGHLLIQQSNVMTAEDFWKLTDHIDRKTLRKGEGFDCEAVEPLVGALARLSKTELEAFEEHLAKMLYLLDGRLFADAAGKSGASSDGFLYARCFVVASGRQVYEHTLRNPSLMPKTLDEWCEPLLFAAADAWEKQTGEEWEYSTSLDYETGSNEAQW